MDTLERIERATRVFDADTIKALAAKLDGLADQLAADEASGDDEPSVYCHNCDQWVPHAVAYANDGVTSFHWNDQGGGHTTRKVD